MFSISLWNNCSFSRWLIITILIYTEKFKNSFKTRIENSLKFIYFQVFNIFPCEKLIGVKEEIISHEMFISCDKTWFISRIKRTRKFLITLAYTPNAIKLHLCTGKFDCKPCKLFYWSSFHVFLCLKNFLLLDSAMNQLIHSLFLFFVNFGMNFISSCGKFNILQN